MHGSTHRARDTTCVLGREWVDIPCFDSFPLVDTASFSISMQICRKAGSAVSCNTCIRALMCCPWTVASGALRLAAASSTGRTARSR